LENKGLLLCVKALQDNTNRASKTLFNASTLDVMVAMTRLSQKGNESYLKLYNDWLDECEKNTHPTKDAIDNMPTV
jgi:hypothetical protein